METLHHLFTAAAGSSWSVFAVIVTVLLALDLGVLNRGPSEIGVRRSLLLSAGYIAVALVFGAWVWHDRGAEAGLTWYTGYLIEKSLSIDNVFVIAMIFGALAVPRALQHRVLFWGVLGAIALRGVMIGLGSALISQFGWVMLVFGAFLVWSGVKMWRSADEAHDVAGHPALQWLRRHLRVTPQLQGQAFLVRLPQESSASTSTSTSTAAGPGATSRRWHATPLLLALVMVELADVVFAVDSVPAVFAVSADPFIVYTSNIFAILGLRALYFALAAMLHRFALLKYALALVLVFIGGKILAGALGWHLPALLSLSVTMSLILGGVLLSVWRTRNDVVA